MIQCNIDKCKQIYIGETGKILSQRIQQHIGYVKNRIFSQATGSHFNLPGHSTSNISVTILEKCKKLESNYRKEREHHLIRKFESFYKGINRMP